MSIATPDLGQSQIDVSIISQPLQKENVVIPDEMETRLQKLAVEFIENARKNIQGIAMAHIEPHAVAQENDFVMGVKHAKNEINAKLHAVS